MDEAKLKEDWLVGNAVVAFVGALLMAQAWRRPDGANELPLLHVTVPTFHEVVIISIVAFLGFSSFVLLLASIVPPLRTSAILQASPFSPLLELLMWIAFTISWVSAIPDLPLDYLWAQVLWLAGAGLFFFLPFRMVCRPRFTLAGFHIRPVFKLGHRIKRRLVASEQENGSESGSN